MKVRFGGLLETVILSGNSVKSMVERMILLDHLDYTEYFYRDAVLSYLGEIVTFLMQEIDCRVLPLSQYCP